ncbi:hypothetical protein AHAS_Ahas11G0123200 [Arachis hypogaea]
MEPLTQGKEYKVIWPDHPEFVRMAARFGATIVPFGTVGEDDIADILLDFNDLAKIPYFIEYVRELQRGLVKFRDEISGEVASRDIAPPLILPKLPGRFYYLFGKPISTKGMENMLKDREAANKLYLQIKSEVENNMCYLLKKRQEDLYRNFIDKRFGEEMRPVKLTTKAMPQPRMTFYFRRFVSKNGRPPFDDTGLVIIMTRRETVHLYENLLNGCEVVESQLLPCVTEHLLAEIVQLTVTDITKAIEWLQCSYLYVRMKKNPENYSIKKGISGDRLVKHVQDICVKKVNELSQHQMVEIDKDGFLLSPLGMLSSSIIYYHAIFTEIRIQTGC